MSTCCTEETGQCCGGGEVSDRSESQPQAEVTSVKSHACCGGQSAH